MIWCVEDDLGIREMEMYTLRMAGFEVEGFEDGEQFFKALKNNTPELIILDIMLPGKDGVEILKELKEVSQTKHIPVIMATAKGMEYDKIMSLDLGADDYLTKPFGMMEMVSRVKAVLRRCQKEKKDILLKLGEISINTSEHTVIVGDEQVYLTLKEYEMLKLFMSHPSIVFTRDQLFDDIWGIDYIGESRTVDVHIRTLRHKLGKCGNYIKTVRGVGYSMKLDAEGTNDKENI